MRIAILSAAKSIHTIKWVNALVKNGHQVALYSLADHKAPKEVFHRDVEVHYLKISGVLGYWLGGGELRRALRRFKPDVLNAHYATGYGTLARRSKFKPLLLSVWGSDVYEFPYQGFMNRKIVNKNLAAATAIASTSKLMAEQVRRICFREKRIFITPFGVDTEQFSPRGTTHGNAVIIGTVKALEKKYGIEYLLRAFSFLSKRVLKEGILGPDELKLEIYGKGSELDALKILCGQLGIEKMTNFRGAIPHSQVPEALSGMDIFCVPSISDSESFGVAAVEAMACSLPVVTSDVDGFREVVKDTVTGFVVTRKDPAMLSNRLYDLVVNRELRVKTGQAARAHVKENYEWQQCVKAMEKALISTAGIE